MSAEVSATKRSLDESKGFKTVAVDAPPKKQRDEETKPAEEKKLDSLVAFLENNVRLVAMASEHTIFHGGLIPADAVSKLVFAKDTPVWFSFDVGHSLEYAFKQGSSEGTLTSFKTKRSLVLLDIRSTAYEPAKPRKAAGESEGEEEEEEDEEDLDENTTELIFDRFRDIQGDCCNEFGCVDNDLDLAALIRDVVTRRKLNIDGIISLDYGTFTEVILFEPASVLAFHESYNPKTQPQTPGHDYAADSLFGDCFDRISFNAKRPGDNLAHAVQAVNWNRKCTARAISDEQRESFVVEYEERLGLLALASC